MSTSALIDCPSCAFPLAVHVPGEAVRESIDPAKGADEALLAAAGFWKRDDVPKRFAEAAPDPPVLLFAAVAESHRAQVTGKEGGGRVAREAYDVALAAPIPGIPLASVDFSEAVATGVRRPFDPARLQKSGLVFDPVKSPAQLFPPDEGDRVDERLTVAYVPFWLVRKRFRLGLYEAVVHGGTGRVVHARAPLARTRKLLEATALVYLLAALVAMPARGWGAIARFLLNFDEPGIAAAFLIPAGLLALAAWAWNRLRFRYELIGDGSVVKRVPINKPAKTFLERATAKALEVAGWILSWVT